MPQWRWEDRINLDRLRKERVEKLREEMKRNGIGTYLCFDPPNVKYLTDIHQAKLLEKVALSENVIFPRTGDPILYTWGSRWRRIRDELAPWLKGNVRPGFRLGFFLTRNIYPEEFIKDLKETMAEHGLSNEPLAIDMPVITLDLRQIFEKAGIKVVDGGPFIRRARMVKTQDEIECQRMASSICDEAYAAMREAIRPGIREYELESIAIDTALKRGADEAMAILVCSGENTTPNMAGAGDRPIRRGDLIFFDMADISWKGYRVCYYRTFSCGKANQRQKDNFQECMDLTYRAIEKVKAGVSTADIVKAWPPPEHWGAKTWWDISECAVGHGIGLWVQEAPGISPLFSVEYPVTLEENMVIALETWYGLKEHPTDGCRFEETLVVKKDGYEILTKWPKDEITEAY
jgi:Xaa-Pro aminopeptidase